MKESLTDAFSHGTVARPNIPIRMWWLIAPEQKKRQETLQKLQLCHFVNVCDPTLGKNDAGRFGAGGELLYPGMESRFRSGKQRMALRPASAARNNQF
jgi:hypothetical protein